MNFGHSRNGMTMLELLVSTAIIAVLVGMSLSGIQSARETARNMDCQNRMRQLGLAAQHFVSVHTIFPHNGGWNGHQVILAVDGTTFTPSTITTSINRYGVGDPNISVREQTGSWIYSVLPYLEQPDLYQNRKWQIGLNTVVCPTRRDAEPLPIVTSDAYATYISGGWEWSRSDFAGNRNIFPGTGQVFPDHNVRASGIIDGLSNTLLIFEKSYNPRVQNGTNWFWDEPFFLGGSGGTVRWESILSLDSVDSQFQRNLGSAHSAGVNMARADGSVVRLSYSTAREIVDGALSLHGNEILPFP